MHGEEEACKARDAAKAVFGAGSASGDMPTTALGDSDFTDGRIAIADLLLKCSLVPSKGEARRLIQQGGVTVNDSKVSDFTVTYDRDSFKDDFVIKKGKKVFHKVTLG